MNNNQLRSSARSLTLRILSIFLALCCWSVFFSYPAGIIPAFARADLDPRIDVSLHVSSSFILVFQGSCLLEGADPLVIAKEHEAFLEWLNYRSVSYEVEHTMMHTLNALVVRLNHCDIPYIKDYPTLKLIIPYQSHLKPARGFAMNRFYPQAKNTTDSWTGKGIRVGIVDTGINTQHPELLGRVVGGKNFARPEGSYEDYGFHGTFVAGVMGGKGKDPFLKGVAPDIEFMSYVVFKDYRSPSVSILPALDQAVKDQCKIVLLALGGISTDYSPEQELMLNALKLMKESKIAVITSAGNLGMPLQKRPSIILPGSSPDVLTVGASDDRKWLRLELENLQKEKKLCQAQFALPGLTFPSSLKASVLVEAGYGRENDFLSAKKQMQDPTASFIALIHRGPKRDPLTFYEKMENAVEAGAKAILFVNYPGYELTQPSLMQERMELDWFKTYVPSAMLSYEDALDLLETPSHWKLLSSFSQTLLSFDSSCGSLSDLAFKPDLIAPGSEIFSLINLGYGWMSGSSISAAFVAGSVACIMQAQPDWSIDQIYSSLVHHCDPLFNPISGHPLPFEMQGAGEIRLDQALQSSLHISPLAIKASYQGQALHQTIQIINSSNQALKEKPNAVFILRNSLQDNPCKLTFHPEQVSIPANGKVELELIFELENSSYKEDRIEGWINVADLALPFVLDLPKKNSSFAPIQNFTLNTSQWDFSENSSVYPIEISFQLIKGRYFKSQRYGDFFLTMAEIDIVLLDKQGLNWGTCFASRECYPDTYQLKLSRLLIDRQTIPPEGSYYLMLRYWAYDMDGKGAFVYHKESIAIEILHSPDPATDISWRAFQKQMLNKKFTIQLLPSHPVKLKKFLVEYRFDPKKLSCQSIEILSLKGLGACQAELVRIGNNADGIIYAEWSCPENQSISIPANYPLLEFGLVGLSTGKAEIFVSKLYGIDENNESISFRFPGFTCQLYSSDFLRGDLNEDGVVDQKDWQIMDQAFGSFYLDPGFDQRANINNDAWVNLLDMTCLAEES